MNDKQDHSDFLVVILILLIAFCNYLYVYKYEWFVIIWYALKAPVYTFISLIDKKVFDMVYSWVFWDKNFTTNVYSIADIMNTYSIEQFRDEQFMNEKLQENGVNLREFVSFVNIVTTKILLIPLIPVAIFLSKKIRNKERYNTVHSIESLGIQESEIWPQIKPVIYEYNNFINTKNLDSGWFAMASKPKDYFLRNNLLSEHINDDEDDFDNFGEKYYKLKTKEMYDLFIKELGVPWTDVRELSFEKKAILSIILPKLMREPKVSEKMNKNLSILHSSYPKKIKINRKMLMKPKKLIKTYRKNKKDNLTRKKILKESKNLRKVVEKDINDILDKYFPKNVYKKRLFKGNKLVKKAEIPQEIQSVLDKHFYEKTVFTALLQEARKTGVLASCEFIWLKKVNRDLWYMMSQAGRTACFSECAGAWSHYLTELRVGRKVASPMVINAIHAADKYMFNTHKNYEPINKYDED